MSQFTSILQLPWVELTDSPNAETATRQLAEAMDTYGIPRFASTAARDAAIPSPQTGQLCYLSSTASGFHVLQCYRGSWRNMGEQPQWKRQVANINKLNNTSLSNTDLVFTGEANSTYTFNGVVVYSTQSAAGADIAFTYPTGATLTAVVYPAIGDGANSGGYQSVYWLPHVEDDGTSPSNRLAMGGLSQATEFTISAPFFGYVTFGSTAGSTTLQFSQTSSFNDTTTMYSGSFIVAHRVA